MSSKRYADEFKIEAVRQVVDRGFPVAEVAGRLGVSTHSMYEWLKKFGPAERRTEELDATQEELRHVKAELSRVTEERDILKKAATYFAKESG